MEEEIRSDSTIGDDWITESSSSLPEVVRSPEQHSEGISDIENAMERMVLDDSKTSSQLKRSVLERFRRTWPNYLGTQNKPGIPHEFIYKGKYADEIHKECLKLAEHLHIPANEAQQLKKVIGFFCEREECRFEVEWMGILEMLIPFLNSLDFVYNAFYAITTKYLPRSTTKGALCYHLMNLILQYHDPALSTHLTSHKLNCYDFAHPCFASLFSGIIEKKSLYAIWDKYFEKGDPFLLFTIVLVFMVNCSEKLMKMNNNDQMVNLVLSSMRALSENDVDDLLDVSVHFLSDTPPSIKQDFQRGLFGSRLASFEKMDVATLLALPVDPRDLIRLTTDENSNSLEPGFNFFIIDARPHDDYAAGHLEGSYNLDSSLFVEAPEQYKMALSGLDAYRDASRHNHHLLFLGAGREECDLYLNMVIANFLQQGRKHVALVQGGYKALHQLLASNLERLEGHNAQRCKECRTDRVDTEVRASGHRKTSWISGMSSLLGAVKAGAPALTERVLNLTQSTRAADAHVATSERHGKRYRNERSVFTLSDSETDAENIVNPFTPSPSTARPRKLSEILAQDDILSHFEGVEVVPDGVGQKTVNCYLALTRTHIHVLHQAEKEGEVITHARHAYGSVLRVSSKKKLPEMITFKFGYTTDDGECKETCMQRFILPRAGDCVKAIKMSIVNLQPGLLF
uniref:TBC1 domain family member 23 n=1 Tax=Ascaris lumbricoides TaxID=6252 RepID=A0A0M3HQ05_ASCLU